MNKIRRQIRIVAIGGCGLLLLLLAHIGFIQVFRHEFWLAHPLNKRTQIEAKGIERGKIIARGGEVLAQSLPDQNGGYRRDYPYADVFAHLIGYDSLTYGRAGLEAARGSDLSGYSRPWRQIGPAGRLLQPKNGDSLLLTLDLSLQQQAYRLLGNRRGAIVLLNARSGAVLAAVSKPSFNPNAIEKEWNTIARDSASPLLNRAVQGLYPPGSTVKVMVADAALQQNKASEQRQFLCEGQLRIPPDYVLHEAGDAVHGRLNLEQALTVSCNVTFATLALELGRSQMAAVYNRFGFELTDDELNEAASQLPDFSQLGDGDLAQTGIGQGSLLTTPLKMATVAAAFANKGVVMKPYLINQVVSAQGEVLTQTQPRQWLRAATAATADRVAAMMATAAKRGTGAGANAYSAAVAGKTGSAENPHGDSHAWFIGFAPVDEPRFAIAIILENAGSGGAAAAPLAGQLLSYAVRQGGDAHD
ncbi:MAG: penicillin-binding transpeptidase domain-containing protein [Sporomusaceae bacterium]|nr:penicillin-binding transpeptidase domain-containing protein [Sporomusaceae bacterium]